MSVLGQLVGEVARAALPEVPLDKGVTKANTGVLLLDTLPLITMLPCCQTLHLYWRRRRYTDFTLFLTGFLLAIVYHCLHMHPEGIANARLLGVPGATWRGLDILMAQALLARTLGHAVGATSTLTNFLANLVFPAALLGYAHLLADGVLTLGFASKVLVLVLIATLASKVLLEGYGSLPKYCRRRGKRTLACFVAAFAIFPLPELFPGYYWLCHSLWHLLMAQGYQLLYSQLLGFYSEERGESSTAASTGTAPSSASCASSATESGGEDAGEVQAGWARELLRPAQQLLRYERRAARTQRAAARKRAL